MGSRAICRITQMLLCRITQMLLLVLQLCSTCKMLHDLSSNRQEPCENRFNFYSQFGKFVIRIGIQAISTHICPSTRVC